MSYKKFELVSAFNTETVLPKMSEIQKKINEVEGDVEKMKEIINSEITVSELINIVKTKAGKYRINGVRYCIK